MASKLNPGAKPFSAAAAACKRTKVHMYLAPTNSGKTTRAIDMLAKAKTGAYAAPLRMLAIEAYERLRATLGDDSVGLVTGEQRINPRARIVCCTVECTPHTGDVLVVDEAHWMIDAERGHVWTRVLREQSYKEMHVIAAPEAEGLLVKMFEVRG